MTRDCGDETKRTERLTRKVQRWTAQRSGQISSESKMLGNCTKKENCRNPVQGAEECVHTDLTGLAKGERESDEG